MQVTRFGRMAVVRGRLPKLCPGPQSLGVGYKGNHDRTCEANERPGVVTKTWGGAQPKVTSRPSHIACMRRPCCGRWSSGNRIRWSGQNQGHQQTPETALSAIGSIRTGGRYNVPNTFPILYCAGSQMTALLGVQALFATADERLRGAPRNPDLVLALRCALTRVLDLTVDTCYRELGTTREELASLTPSRFIANAREDETPT